MSEYMWGSEIRTMHDQNFRSSQPAWLTFGAEAMKRLVDAGGPLSYGEQCADTDGLAAVSGTRLATDQEMNGLVLHLQSELRALKERVAACHVYIARLEAERSALRVELAQRKALPLNALRHGGIR